MTHYVMRQRVDSARKSVAVRGDAPFLRPPVICPPSCRCPPGLTSSPGFARQFVTTPMDRAEAVTLSGCWLLGTRNSQQPNSEQPSKYVTVIVERSASGWSWRY